MTPSVSRRDSASPSPSTAKRKTQRVIPLWEAARAQRLNGTAPTAGNPR
jgi:hypothetical protein